MKFNAFGRSASVRTALMAGAAAMVLPAAAQAQDAEDEAYRIFSRIVQFDCARHVWQGMPRCEGRSEM